MLFRGNVQPLLESYCNGPVGPFRICEHRGAYSLVPCKEGIKGLYFVRTAKAGASVWYSEKFEESPV